MNSCELFIFHWFCFFIINSKKIITLFTAGYYCLVLVSGLFRWFDLHYYLVYFQCLSTRYGFFSISQQTLSCLREKQISPANNQTLGVNTETDSVLSAELNLYPGVLD